MDLENYLIRVRGLLNYKRLKFSQPTESYEYLPRQSVAGILHCKGKLQKIK